MTPAKPTTFTGERPRFPCRPKVDSAASAVVLMQTANMAATLSIPDGVGAVFLSEFLFDVGYAVAAFPAAVEDCGPGWWSPLVSHPVLLDAMAVLATEWGTAGQEAAWRRYETLRCLIAADNLNLKLPLE